MNKIELIEELEKEFKEKFTQCNRFVFGKGYVYEIKDEIVSEPNKILNWIKSKLIEQIKRR